MQPIDFNTIWEKLKGDSANIVINLIQILVVYLLGRLILNRISAYTKRTIDKAQKMDDKDKSKQLITVMTVFRSVSRYVIYFLIILFILNQFGFSKSVDSILVTAGIGSLVISLGAQNIIKDMLAGLFIIFDRHYAVGDYVKIGDHTGTVTSIAVRSTYLVNYEGQKIIIPNGQVNSVINYGNSYSLAKIVIPSRYTDDSRKVIQVLQTVCDEYYKTHTEVLLEPPTVLGITGFSALSCDITITAKALPLKHWQVERDIRLLAKEKLEAAGLPLK